MTADLTVPTTLSHPEWRWTIGRRRLWVILAILAVVGTARGFWMSIEPPATPRDFFQEWASARNYVSGLPVYTRHEDTFVRYLGYVRDPDNLDPGKRWFMEINHHPPTAVLFVLPFSALGYASAHVAWNILSMVALAVSVALILRTLRIAYPIWAVFPTIVFLMSCPVRTQLFNANWNCFFLLLATATWLAHRSGRSCWAALALSVMTAIKFAPAFLFLYFVARRDWRTLAWGGIWLAIILALTVAVFGIDTCLGYLTETGPLIGNYKGIWCNHSLTGFWFKLFAPSPKSVVIDPLYLSPGLATAGSSLSILLVAVIVVWTGYRAQSQGECDTSFAVALLGLVLASPVAWIHYVVMLVLPLVVLWLWLPASGWQRWLFWICVAILWKSDNFYCNLCGIDLSLGSTSIVAPWQTLCGTSLPLFALAGLFCLTLRVTPVRGPEGAAHGVVQ